MSSIPSPLFSVIIPTYNRAGKLLRALESLNSQTYRNFEVLVCDDGSTDNTREMLKTFSATISFKKLHYFFEPNWGGPARPRNTGVLHAAAAWVCFLDSDDTWYPTKLADMLPALPHSDLIYHNFDLMLDGHRRKHSAARTLRPPVFEDLMVNGHNGCIINSGVCVRTEILRKVNGCSENKNLIGLEDADLWLRIALLTNRFTHIDKPLGAYYLEGENLTLYNQQMISKLDLLFAMHAPSLKTKVQQTQAYHTHQYHIARIYRLMNEHKKALRAYRMAMRSPNPDLVIKSLFWQSSIVVRELLGLATV